MKEPWRHSSHFEALSLMLLTNQCLYCLNKPTAMRVDCIRAMKFWRNGPGRYDTNFVNTDSSADGMRGVDVARIRLFFSFSDDGVEYSCPLVHWLSRVGDSPDEHTGMCCFLISYTPC